MEGAKPQQQRRAPHPESLAYAQAMVRQQEAAEDVRRSQQGHGRPIITWQDEALGVRFVAIGKQVMWSKNWVTFPNFLLDFLKETMGKEWGAREQDNGKHPLFRWLQKTQEYSAHKPGDPKIKNITIKGFMLCWMNLAYALYLIAHHDQIPKLLLRRLRDPVTFMPAFYEALVGAALAIAGMEISCVETKRGSKPMPEFKAKSRASGKVYEVEAKCKDSWKTSTVDVSNPDFQRELEVYVRDQVYNASRKRLANPIYWFERAIPTMQTLDDWRIVAEKTAAVIKEAESNLKVNREPIAPAYVVITNNTFLVNEDMTGYPHAAVLQNIKMDDFPFGRFVQPEAALAGYDRHRDMFWMMDCWKTAGTVPTTFDGSLPQLLESDGTLKPIIKIGDMVEAPGADGKIVPGRVEDIVSSGPKQAMAVVSTPSGNVMISVPLSNGEAEALETFGDSVFGKANATKKLRENDPFDLYDFFLESYRRMTQADLDRFIAREPGAAELLQGLSLEEARVRIARQYTKSAWIKSEMDKAAKDQRES